MTGLVEWFWKYSPNMHSLTLTVSNVSVTSNSNSFVLCFNNNRLESVPLTDSSQKGVCLLNDKVVIDFPSTFRLNSEPNCQIDESVLRLTWSNTYPTSPPIDKTSQCLEKLDCQNCAQALVEQAVFKPLPSEYWSELLDCWSCHRQEFAGVARNLIDTEYIIPSEPGVVYYSHIHYIVLSNENINSSGECAKCGHLLGFPILNSNNINGRCAIRVPITRTTCSLGIQKYISNIIMEAMSAHSSFTFHLNFQLSIKLVNWSSWISKKNSADVFPVILVDESASDCSHQQSDQYHDEHIQLFPDEFNALLDTLKEQKIFMYSYLMI